MPDGRDVICDTSPLLFLHALEKLELLHALYGTITVPEGVLDEIIVGRHAGAPSPAIETLEWCRIIPAPTELARDALVDLGPGEREVLALARQRRGNLVVLDDRLARRYASVLGLRMTGTLGVLLRAKHDRLVSAVAPLVDRLARAGFRLDTRTRSAVLTLAGEAE